MVNLDDPKLFKQYDREGMLEHLHQMPQLCQEAWQMAMKFKLPQDYGEVNKVVISGMGGSAIGGLLAKSLILSEARLPIFIHSDYGLPAFVDDKTLLIASSYSGMTEETLSSFEKALTTGSKKLAITTGGTLESMAEERNIPVFSFDYKAPPRTALPFNFLPILGFLGRLGFIGDKSKDVAEMVQILEEMSQEINETQVSKENPAKKLAQEFHGKLVVVYGASILSEVAHRWKTQLNENAKAWAFHEVFPELNHNAVVGYQFPPELAGKIAVVLLRSNLFPERIKLRYKVTSELLEQAKVSYHFVDGRGRSPLSQLMSLVLFGDYLSYYLAILYQIDPTPVKAIDYLKEQLGKG